MAQRTLEGIKGGGGSIKLGTTGTISTLMTRELDHISSAPHKHASSSRTKPSSSRTLPVSVACGSSTPKRLQPRKSSDEAASSSSSGSRNNLPKHRTPGGKTHKTKSSNNNGRNTHRIPILGSDNFPLDRSPAREKKNEKKVPHIVEVVDIKCGNTDKAWATPLTSRLKKLGFSKLSESII